MPVSLTTRTKISGGAGIVREEQDIHRAVVKHLEARGARGLLFWHSPQGAHYSSRVQGSIMAGLGVRPGVADLLLVHKGKFYALELKAPGQAPSSVQQDFLGAIVLAGGRASWADSLDKAIAQLEQWGMLRGRMQ